MKLKACGYYVLIEIPAKEDEIESSLLYIPDDVKDQEIVNSDVGIVRDIGLGAFSGMEAVNGATATERAKQWGFEVGDKVEFTRYDGKRPSQEGYENYRFIQDQHIISKIEEQTMGLEEANEVEDQLDDQPEQEQEEVIESNPDEDKARKGGWTNKDEWSDAGHNPDDWKSAKNFNEFGDLLQNYKGMRKEFDDSKSQFDERLTNQRTMLDAVNKQKIADLQAQRQVHVENADIDAFNSTQKQIDNLAEEKEPAPQVANPAEDTVNKWNADNPWIHDGSPKAAYGISEFNRLKAVMPISDAIKAMESSVRNAFPEVNERRQMANKSEVPRRSNTAKPKTLSMKDVTSEEKKFQHMFMVGDKLDEKAFLQAVKDTRD